MNGPEALVWWLCFTIAVSDFARADQDENEIMEFSASRGIRFHFSNNQTSIVLRMSALLEGNGIEQRDTGRFKFKEVIQRISSGLMMLPVIIQIMSLPGTLASIKFSLIRSIIVGNLALMIILYNLFKNSQQSEVVVVQKPEYHEHFYNSYHQPEDDDEGWLGR